MPVVRRGIGALDVGKSAAKEGHICADDDPCSGEDGSIDVDVCVDLCEILGRFSQEEFCVAEVGIVGLVPFSFDGWDKCEDTETGFVLCVLEGFGGLGLE